MQTFVFESQTILNAPIDQVFEFFSKAENLERITPPSLSFQILTPLPIEMATGALIDYRIKLGGFAFRWRTEITLWDPPRSFKDSQLKGPYKKWIHEHRFEELDGRTRMTDRVEYSVPGGILSALVNALFVKSQVRKIFTYREQAIQEIFP